MLGKATKVGATLIILMLILGIGYHLYQLYYTAQNITIRVSVDSIELGGLNPPLDLVPNAINLRFKVLVDNPSPYSIEIERLQYTVYIEERYLGEVVSKEDIYIASHATTPIYLSFRYLSFRATTSDVLGIIGDLIKRGDTAIDYSIKGFIRGSIRIPVKLFGTIKLLSVDIPFEKKGYYVIPIQPPDAKPTNKSY